MTGTEHPVIELDHLRESPAGDPDGVTFIGTATVIIRFGGFTILTDPNFLHAGQHAYLGMGLRSKRLKNPAMKIDQLPPFDAVVLSHHHGDHFDNIARDGLPKDIPIITEPHAAKKLSQQGFTNVRPLATWETQELRRGDRRLRVTSMPGKHSPQPLGLTVPPVMGSMLEYTQDGTLDFRLYITGDTLLCQRLEEIPRRYPDIDLCLIHLGGTRILGIMLTMDAAQGVEALRLIGPREAVPIHFDDYPVFKSSLEDFRRAVDQAGLDTTVRYLDRGEAMAVVPRPR